MSNVEFSGDMQVAQLLKLGDRMKEWRRLIQRDLLKSVAEVTVKQARRRIKTGQHSPDLKPWPARKHPAKHPPLRKSGKLMRSIRKIRRSAAEYEAGAMRPYGKFQQFGTKRGIEPRAFVGVGFDDVRKIEAHIESWVIRRMR